MRPSEEKISRSTHSCRFRSEPSSAIVALRQERKEGLAITGVHSLDEGANQRIGQLIRDGHRANLARASRPVITGAIAGGRPASPAAAARC